MQKRTEMQIAQDRARVCELLLQGVETRAEIADIINSGRPTEQHISVTQIQHDIDVMKKKHKEKGVQDYDEHLNRLLDELKLVKKSYWKGYELSRRNKISIESDFITDVEEYGELAKEGVGLDPYSESVFARQAKVREEVRLEGNPAFLQGVLSCIEKETKLLGLDVNKIAMTDDKGKSDTSNLLTYLKDKISEISTVNHTMSDPKLLTSTEDTNDDNK